jgi:CBS domain-containing protein
VGLGLFSVLAMHFVAGIWLLIIGVFLKRSADNEFRAFELRAGLEGLRLRQIMSPAVAVEKSMLVSDFINDYVFHYHDRAFPVIENGRFAGMIDLRSIKRIAVNEWPLVRIGGYMADPSTYFILEPDVEASEALRLLVSGNRTCAPIVHDGVLLGMLTRDDLFKLISVKRDLAA